MKVSRAWCGFVTRAPPLRDAPVARVLQESVMRLALVSTFPPAECGIGNYSHELVTALRREAPDVEVVVIAERDPRATESAEVLRAWHRKETWVPAIAAAVERVRPDVVHVQHEESFLGHDGRMIALLEQLRARGIRSVVTLHTVHGGVLGGAYHRKLARACDRLVVHQRTGNRDTLLAQGVPPERVQLIAHGTPALALPDRATARAQLELPQDVPIALFFGFIHFRKRVHVAIDAFERSLGALGDARFVIAGRLRRSHILDTLYAKRFARSMRAGVAAGRIIYRPGFVPPEHKAAYYAAADVVVMPHVQPYGSASGVLHEALAARRAILCTRGKKFAEAVEALSDEFPDAFPLPDHRASWQRGFESLLGSEARRAALAVCVGTLAEETSWAHSAQRHADLYRSLVMPPPVAATAAAPAALGA